MKYTIKLAGGIPVTFNSLIDFANHYGTLADAYRRTADKETGKTADEMRGKAEAYSAVCWQIAQMRIEE